MVERDANCNFGFLAQKMNISVNEEFEEFADF